MFRQCFQNNLVIVVLNIQIIIPSSSKLMLNVFRFLVLKTCGYRPFTFFRLFWELYFSSFFFSIFGRNFSLCAIRKWLTLVILKFLGNLNEAISMVETDITLKVTYISGNGIAVFKFAQKIFFKGKLQQHQRQILSITPSRINPFVPNAPFLYPWKQQKTVRFSGVEKGCIGDEWVNTEK